MLRSVLILVLFTGLSLLNVYYVSYNMMLIALIVFVVAYSLAVYKQSKAIILVGTALYFLTSLLSNDVKFVFASSYPLLHFSFFYLVSSFGKRKYQKEYVQLLGTGGLSTGNFDLLDLIFSIFSIAFFALVYCAYALWL